MFGLSPWLLAGIVAAIAIIAGEGIALNGAWDSKAAAERDLGTMTGLRDGLLHDLDNAIEARDREHREADAADAAAKKALADQRQQASQIRTALDAATNQTETLIQQIQDARHARPIVLSQTVTDGFDPLIVAGLERLKCVQRAGNRGQPADGCGVPVSDTAGRAGTAGAAAGAGDYRPGFDAQLRMLNDMWRLHDWGASCYADKRAIAASQNGAQP